MAEIDEGSVIGNYRVIRLLGQGGMGTVYEVEHLELGTHYALKTFTFDPDNDANHALKKKFLEEGKLLARLKHPNLTHVFDLGFEDETQMPYFVMDLVTYEDGETYTVEDIDLKDIDEDMVYGWFKQLASALDYIHGEGIVHRDIKPSNLLVDKDLNVVLTDFGISRIFGQKIKSEVEATRTMVSKTGRGKLVLGTEHYIAPEVADGEEATPKADAYSLGVMLLRWLTGFYYGDNPGAVALLSRKKYQWVGVISLLLAPASRRPEKYSELVRQLKPAPKPAPAAKPPQGKKKRNRTKENVIIAVAALLAVGVLGAGGYGVWRYVENRNAERDRQVAALAQQIREKEEADRKAKAEAEAAKKAKEAEEKRIAEERVIVPTNTPVNVVEKTEPVVMPTPKVENSPKLVSDNDVPEIEITPQKDERESAKRAEETYGPIPNVLYKWYAHGKDGAPLAVKFLFANKATMDLLPNAKGIFYMSNMMNENERMKWDAKAYHKVKFTYDFWISKHLVTAEQWREFSPLDCEDCRELEVAIKGEYPVVKRFSYHSITSFCGFLSRKYKSQLPDGYVFRLPTEAEYEYSYVADSLLDTLRNTGSDKYHLGGTVARQRLEKLSREKHLDRFVKWDKSCLGLLAGTRVQISGLVDAFPSGIYDCWHSGNPVADRLKILDVPVNYNDEEVDPLHWTGLDNMDEVHYTRPWITQRYESRADNWVFHIVLAPGLDKLNKYDEDSVLAIKNKPKNIPNKKYDFSVPKKLTHPKELVFKLANGADMIFNGCPAGKFRMSNVPKQNKEWHEVEITRPFWMTKYNVTIRQWEEYSENDYPGVYQRIQRAFTKYPTIICTHRKGWTEYCNYLTATYGALLPDGYVFRLPTEAEWEYAFRGGSRQGDVSFVDVSSESKQCREQFAKVLKKHKEINTSGEWKPNGWFNERLKIGGRAKHHGWGFYDMWEDKPQMVLDTFCYESQDWFGDAANHTPYPDKDVDPLYWAGDKAVRGLARQNFTQRWHLALNCGGSAHIVIGPDLLKERNVGQKKNDSKVLQKTLAPIVMKLAEKNEIEFVGCPAGLFEMGVEGDKEKNSCTRQHTVNITRPFWLSKFQVTKRQWSVYQKPKLSKYDEAMGGLETPMWEGVSYVEAMKFCEFLTKRMRNKLPPKYVVRLPTEAEWEYALRMNDFQDGCRYQDWEHNLNAISIVEGDVRRMAAKKNFDLGNAQHWEFKPIQVGTKEPNAIGLYDMLSNGFELMLDVVDPAKCAIKAFLSDDKNQSALVYADVETDPLHFHDWGTAMIRGASFNCKEGSLYVKRLSSITATGGGPIAHCIRLCIGPDLMKEKKIKFKVR